MHDWKVQYLKRICSFELKSAVLFRKMKSQLHQFIQLGCSSAIEVGKLHGKCAATL